MSVKKLLEKILIDFLKYLMPIYRANEKQSFGFLTKIILFLYLLQNLHSLSHCPIVLKINTYCGNTDFAL